MPSFGESNHRKWKAKQAALGLRLISAKPRLNDRTPAEWDEASRAAMWGLSNAERAAEFVKRQQARTDDEPPEAA